MNTLKRKVKQGLLRDDIDGKHYMSWMGFEFAISEFVKDYKKNGYSVDAIYGPPRGGLPIAVTLSHRLGIPIVDSTDKFWEMYARPRVKMLVVDDIADTGETLKPLIGPNIISYTIYYHKQSVVVPDYHCFEKKDEWVVFPWEEDIYGYEANN
jgi:hypoxanthine phosphoribosyltransferase